MSTAAPGPADAADDRGTGTGSSLRILVVDADDRTRESIVGILGIRHRFDVVGSAAQVADAIALVKRHRPDVVILDPRLPEVSGGLTLIRRMRAIDPEIRILAVGWSPELEHQALDAGADGFVRKTFKPGDLAAAVARCMDSRLVAGDLAFDEQAADASMAEQIDAAIAQAGVTAAAPAGGPSNPAATPAVARSSGVVL